MAIGLTIQCFRSSLVLALLWTQWAVSIFWGFLPMFHWETPDTLANFLVALRNRIRNRALLTGISFWRATAGVLSSEEVIAKLNNRIQFLESQVYVTGKPRRKKDLCDKVITIVASKLDTIHEEIAHSVDNNTVAEQCNMQRLIDSQNEAIAALARKLELQSNLLEHSFENMKFDLLSTLESRFAQFDQLSIDANAAMLSQRAVALPFLPVSDITRRLDVIGGRVSHCINKLDGVADLAMVQFSTTTPHSRERSRKAASPVKKNGGIVNSGLQQAEDADEVSKCHTIIGDLRAQVAANAAAAARKDELVKTGRVLQTVHVPTGSNETHFPIAEMFLRHAGASDGLVISEPYLVSTWQISNLEKLIEELISRTHIRCIKLSTHSRSQCSEGSLASITARCAKLGIVFSYAYVSDLHVRELIFNNGIVVSSDRGLDLYRSPDAAGSRGCRNTTIVTYEVDKGTVAKSFNVAEKVAADARELLAADVTKDLARIDALVKDQVAANATTKQQWREDTAAKKYRQLLEGKKVMIWIKELGYKFTAEALRIMRQDGYDCPAQYFVSNMEICGKDPFNDKHFQSEIRSWMSLELLAEGREIDHLCEGYSPFAFS